jgi:hypothetical protein
MKIIVGTASQTTELVTDLAADATREELADFLKQTFDDLPTADMNSVHPGMKRPIETAS